MDVLTTRELTTQELDTVAGGLSILAVAATLGGFIYMNLDKLADSYQGFMHGLGDGFNGSSSGGDVTAVCSP
jgi:hypothetical protein